MKKILYIVSTLKRSGPINQLYGLLSRLDRNQYIPHILTLSPEASNSRRSDFEQLDITIESLNNRRLRGAFRNQTGIKSIIENCRPDLVHTSGIRADIATTSLPTPPHVATIHSLIFEDYLMSYGKLMGKLMVNLHARKMPKINQLIGVSNTVTDQLSNRLQLSNMQTIQNGVNSQYFHPLVQSEKIEKRKKLGLPAGATIFISVGHLSKLKDPISIINAFKKTKNHKTLLLFLGNGTLEKTCRRIASEDPRIKFLGFQSNTKNYFQVADIFVSASKSEGLPTTVLEALSCGLPCVLSDIPQHQEFFEYNKNIGTLFELGNQESLYEKLTKIANTSRQEMVLNARKVIEENLSTQTMAEKYQSIYKDLISA